MPAQEWCRMKGDNGTTVAPFVHATLAAGKRSTGIRTSFVPAEAGLVGLRYERSACYFPGRAFYWNVLLGEYRKFY